MRVDRICMELPILYFKGSQIEMYFCHKDFFCLCKLTVQSTDLDKMLLNGAFYLGLHCVP